MNISIDGGAICPSHGRFFGNYIFTRNLLESLQIYDNKTTYHAYTFCPMPPWFPQSNKFLYLPLRPKALWLTCRVSIEELRSRKDIFLALNQAIPLYTSSTIISFSHGLSFYFFPQLYKDMYYALKDQLLPMIKKSKYILVSSWRVKQEMQALYPHYDNFIVNNYGVPFDMMKYDKKERKKFFLYVGMNHPIKNIDFIIKAFQKFREQQGFKEYSLYLAGNLNEYEDKSHNIKVFDSTSRAELKDLYAEATACVTASFYESYNIPVLEAISQRCPVIGLRSAIIPEFKPYLFKANYEDDFIKQMNNVAEGASKNINLDYIKKVFSWKKYVEKLVSLYK